MKSAPPAAPATDDLVQLMFFQSSGAGHRPPGAAEAAAPAPAQYHPLRQSRLRPDAGCHLPPPGGGTSVRLQSPAIEAMTDFRSVVPVTIAPSISVDEANRTMINRGVRTLFVVDGQ